MAILNSNDTRRWRSENYSGSGVREAKDVIFYEFFVLGNTDVFEYIVARLPDSEVKTEAEWMISDMTENWFVELCEDEKLEFCEKLLAEYGKLLGVQIKYALWLADKEIVNKHYCGSENSTKQYNPGESILNDIDVEGILYGYAEMPTVA